MHTVPSETLPSMRCLVWVVMEADLYWVKLSSRVGPCLVIISLSNPSSVGIVILACTLFIIYAVIIVYVFLKREEYPIYNRSPYLILLGAFGKSFLLSYYYWIGLLLDAECNVWIASLGEGQSDLQCFLSIMCTLLFHYLAYFSIIIRYAINNLNNN